MGRILNEDLAGYESRGSVAVAGSLLDLSRFKITSLGALAMAANDILCPICGGAIDLKEFTTDEHGLAVHIVCLTLKKQGMRADPPKKPEKS